MNYIDEIFFRGDIQQIREFLLHGVEGEVDPRAYKERQRLPLEVIPPPGGGNVAQRQKGAVCGSKSWLVKCAARARLMRWKGYHPFPGDIPPHHTFPTRGRLNLSIKCFRGRGRCDAASPGLAAGNRQGPSSRNNPPFPSAEGGPRGVKSGGESSAFAQPFRQAGLLFATDDDGAKE